MHPSSIRWANIKDIIDTLHCCPTPYKCCERVGVTVLTHWGRDKMAAISQTTLSNAFSWMKMLEFRLNFHWSLFLRFQLKIFQHWFRWWLGADQATSHYLNQWWLDYRRIYASLGLNELTHWGLINMACFRVFHFLETKVLHFYSNFAEMLVSNHIQIWFVWDILHISLEALLL